MSSSLSCRTPLPEGQPRGGSSIVLSHDSDHVMVGGAESALRQSRVENKVGLHVISLPEPDRFVGHC